MVVLCAYDSLIRSARCRLQQTATSILVGVQLECVVGPDGGYFHPNGLSLEGPSPFGTRFRVGLEYQAGERGTECM